MTFIGITLLETLKTVQSRAFNLGEVDQAQAILCPFQLRRIPQSVKNESWPLKA
jgi:hypothetical protein